MGEYTAFFYGTLMAPCVLHRVIHGTHTPEPWQKDLITVRPAMLQNYRRHRVRHADYPAIIPHSGSKVRGSLVTGLTQGDIYRLDIFEGSQYKRDVVKVQVLKDVELDQAAPEQDKDPEVLEEVEAQTYVWLEGETTLEPQEWDFEAFKRDKMHAWMGINEDDDVEIDEGFADVDRAVAEEDSRRTEGKTQEKEVNTTKHDPMGGRGANGHITQQLKDAAV
ncbi:uncharacterized protein Z520_05875 [Fonsecaea multimorphosa CBS 102226]|uniref:Putative gamma-glutamylcyclotransferase n=1 Tax=Fonsecaea multimorphosa CBS 102226 TaxID=1442371 RepID=A0A0D2K5X7_9EURO|nr:uncharacterized protein Z520_05875 [Fonsecaea multimorphosa CBS 102226]KIX98574.1 hypothetical protein Z520_05875 [Fonsecaea multimorphosa CBS 102226]OAL24766.1 hypothetical protein AYO22_05555 [Fonsecaea multimorphosa]